MVGGKRVKYSFYRKCKRKKQYHHFQHAVLASLNVIESEKNIKGDNSKEKIYNLLCYLRSKKANTSIVKNSIITVYIGFLMGIMTSGAKEMLSSADSTSTAVFNVSLMWGMILLILVLYMCVSRTYIDKAEFYQRYIQVIEEYQKG